MPHGVGLILRKKTGVVSGRGEGGCQVEGAELQQARALRIQVRRMACLGVSQAWPSGL